MEKFDINAVGAFNYFELISNKTCYKACGYSDDDLSRPIIGIANSYNEMVSGHINLREDVYKRQQHGCGSQTGPA